MKKDWKIPFADLRLSPDAEMIIGDCLRNNWVTMGPKVQRFEENFKKIYNYPYCRMLSSGTSADTAACMALYGLGAEPGDEIICPALSYIATANAIRFAGFKPVFVDVERHSLNINPEKIEEKVGPKTRAVMSVNLMGRPADLDIIGDLCLNKKLCHIVDNCEAYGSRLNGKLALAYTDFETTSHYAAHIVQAAEGGCVFTNTEDHDKLIEAIRSHGRMHGSLYFDHVLFGGNFKPSDLHAAIGLDQLNQYEDNWTARKDVMEKIRKAMMDIRLYDVATFNLPDDDRYYQAPHGFSVVFDYQSNGDIYSAHLQNRGIEVKRNFGAMPTQHKCFEYLDHKLGDFPVAEQIGTHGHHIGVHRYMTDNDIDYITEVTKEAMGMMKK